jgi:SAM-dependent methyltransferase
LRERTPARATSPYLAEFLGLYIHDPAIGLLRAAEAELVSARSFPAPLLDLGCGDGSFGARAVAGGIAVGVDRNADRLKAARATGAYAAVVLADAHRLPFREAAFGSVLSNSTLEHIPGVESVLRETARVLRPGGSIVFTLHNDRFSRHVFFWPRLFRLLGRPHWTERYRRSRLRRLAMANLFSGGEWQEVLARCGLEAEVIEGYLSGRADVAFERLLVMARFGLGRAHLSAAIRLLGNLLDGLGLKLHRRLGGRMLARILEDAAGDPGGEPAAMLISARSEQPAVRSEPLPPVVGIAGYRSGKTAVG